MLSEEMAKAAMKRATNLICGLILAAAFGLGDAGAKETRYTQIFVFGDSYSDNGAGFQYGNGPPAVVHMAWLLGLTLVPADEAASPGQSLDFAVSGAATGDAKGARVEDAMVDVGMTTQVADFATRVRAGKIKFAPATTLFFLAGGLNDKSSAQVSIGNLRRQIEMLSGLGAAHVRIALLPVKIAGMEGAGQRLNGPISGLAETLRKTGGLDVQTSQWGLFYDEVYENPSRYGITDTRSACAGVALFGEPFHPCPHPEKLYFYHSGHPSAVTHQAVGEMLAREMGAAR